MDKPLGWAHENDWFLYRTPSPFGYRRRDAWLPVYGTQFIALNDSFFGPMKLILLELIRARKQREE